MRSRARCIRSMAWPISMMSRMRSNACWLPQNVPNPAHNTPPNTASRIPMRLIRSALLAAVSGLLGLGAGHAHTDGGDLERVVARNVQDMLPDDGHGGVAVALRSGGRILFYNYGKANAGLDRPIEAGAIFNLASVGKLFATTLLAQA